MKTTVTIGLVILGLSPLTVAAGTGDKTSGIHQHSPVGRHFPGMKVSPNDHGSQGGPGSMGNGDTGSMNFKPLLGDQGQGGPGGGTNFVNVLNNGGNPGGNGGNGNGGNGPGGNPPGGDPPGGNPPGGNPPGGDPPPTWGGPIGGTPGGGSHTVPEMDPASGMGALTLLSGALLVIRGRRKKVQ